MGWTQYFRRTLFFFLFIRRAHTAATSNRSINRVNILWPVWMVNLLTTFCCYHFFVAAQTTKSFPCERAHSITVNNGAVNSAVKSPVNSLNGKESLTVCVNYSYKVQCQCKMALNSPQSSIGPCNSELLARNRPAPPRLKVPAKSCIKLPAKSRKITPLVAIAWGRSFSGNCLGKKF